jgi:hypothetical protein
MSHVHVKINFLKEIDSWNRCLSVHKRLQIRAQGSVACSTGIQGRILSKITKLAKASDFRTFDKSQVK